MSCSRQAHTNQEVDSILFDQLFKISKDEQLADNQFNYFKHVNFLNIFGDYISNHENIAENKEFRDRVDENGEPKLFLNKNLNKYYFLDFENEPIEYPYNQGLRQFLSTNDVKSVAKIIALKFYEDNLDFDYNTLAFSNKAEVGLREYIKNFLVNKGSQLSKDVDFLKQFKGDALLNSTPYLNEWANEVKDFFSTLKIDLDLQDEIDEQETSTRGEVFRKESFLKSSKNNVNNNIKLFLSLLKTSTLNDFDEFNFVPFDDIYSTLNKKLANKVAIHDSEGQLEDLYDIFLTEILETSKVKPYLKDLHDQLNSNKVTDLFKNQFVAAFNLYSKNYLGSEITLKDGEIYYDVRNLSEVSSRKNTIISLWTYNSKLIDLSNAKLKYAKQELQKLSNSYNPAKITSESFAKNLKALKEIFNYIGVEITDQGFDYYLTNIFGDSLEGRGKAFSRTLDNFLRGIDAQIEDELQGNIFLKQSIFKEMADAEAFFIEDGSDASIFTLGKTKWMYSLPSHLEKLIKSWQKNPRLLKQLYDSDPFYQGSHWMKFYLALDVEESKRDEVSKERLADIEIGVFNSVQQKGDSLHASDNKDLSYTDSLVDYINKLLAFKKGNKVWHKTALAAGKNTEYQIKWGTNKRGGQVFSLEANADISDDIIIFNKKITEIFYTYFKSEYERMNKAAETIKRNNPLEMVVHYHTGNKNALKSQLFPSLSISFDEEGNVSLPNLDMEFPLYDNEGYPTFKNLDAIKDDILPFINKAIRDGISHTIGVLEENNIIYYDSNGIRQNQGIATSVFNSYLEEAGQNKKLAVTKIAADLFINSVVSQQEYSKLVTGDVAYYKDFSDYKKRVPATYTDGIYLRLQPGEEEFNIAVMSAVNVPVPNLAELEKMLPDNIFKLYKQVNATDAQAWITPERWEFIMKRLGKWNEHAESAYKKFYEKNPIFTTKELKILAQPLKGVYFDVKDGRPVYLKYSQAVLLPNLIKNTPLERVYNQMVKGKEYKDQIHELITEDGIKVGLPVPTTIHTESGNVAQDFTFTPLKLNNSSWKLQQDLPTKGIKLTDVGSQIQENIFQGLAYNLDKTFSVAGEEFTGERLIHYINDLFGALSNKGVRRLYSRLGIDPETLKIENEDALYDNIILQLSKRNDVPSNFLNGLKAKTSPYGIPGAFQMFQNIFSSIVNDETIKIKTNGAGFIQMADFGLSKSEAQKANMIFTPWFAENETKLSPPILGKNKEGKDIIQPGGIFLSGSFIAKYIPDYKTLTPEQLFGTLNEETGKYENGRIDEKILRNIIGYRIPNQGLSSNDALQIMGILPEEIGDTVIAYTGITKKTGSDFDIDKMYLMIPSFDPIFNNEVKQRVSDFLNDQGIDIDKAKVELHNLGINTKGLPASTIFALLIDKVLYDSDFALGDKFFETAEFKSARRLVYSEDDDVLKGLYQMDKKVLQNRLIESYKAVLTSPDVIADIMNPIDVPFIKDDIKNLVNDEKKIDLLEFSAIEDLKLKNEFMLGKAGLGQNINSLVDSVRGSMANLYFRNTDEALEWGLYNEKGQTIFDNEYSEELTPKEINEYVESFGYKTPEERKALKEAIQKVSKVKLGESMMGLVNGFVDIEKDTYIVKGNWVTQTNNIGFMLLRAGVHPFKVNAFLAQPILKEYVQFVSNQESKTIDSSAKLDLRFKLKKAAEIAETYPIVAINNIAYSKKELLNSLVHAESLNDIYYAEEADYDAEKVTFFESVRKELYKKFNIETKDITPTIKDQIQKELADLVSIYDTIFEAELIDFETIKLKDLREQIKVESSIDVQLTILNKFLTWQDKAKVLTKNVNVSKVKVNGKGKNITSLIIALNTLEDVMYNDVLGGFDSKLEMNDNKTALNYSIRNSLNKPFAFMQANPKFFLTAGLEAVSTFNKISQAIYGEKLQSQILGDKLEKAHYSFILSGFPALQMSKAEREDLLERMPEEVLRMKQELNDNALLNEIGFKEGNEKTQNFISMPNIRKSVGFKNTLVDSWDDLFKSYPKFAEDLVKYAYLISGFNNNLNQFHEYIPYQWFNKNRFNSYLKMLSFNKERVDQVFLNQFFRHSTEDKSIVKQIFANEMLPFVDPANPRRTSSSSVFVTKYEKSNPPYLVYRVVDHPEYTITNYYELAGLNKYGQAVYTRTTPLGYKDLNGNRAFEYDKNYLQSIVGVSSSFDENFKDYKDVDENLIKTIREKFEGTRVEDDLVTEVLDEENELSAPTKVEEVKSIEEDQQEFDFPC